MKINFKIRSHQQIKQMKEWTDKHSPYRVWWPVQKYVHLGSNISRLCTPTSLLQHITMSISASAYSVWIHLCLVFFNAPNQHLFIHYFPQFHHFQSSSTLGLLWTLHAFAELPNKLNFQMTCFLPISILTLSNYYLIIECSF